MLPPQSLEEVTKHQNKHKIMLILQRAYTDISGKVSIEYLLIRNYFSLAFCTAMFLNQTEGNFVFHMAPDEGVATCRKEKQ